MKPLLLTDYGTCLKTKDRALVLWNQDTGERREWTAAAFPFDSIIVDHLGGFVTFPALRWLSTNGVSLTALDFNGSVLGSWLPDHPTNARDRLAQYAAFLDPARRVSVARFILEAKVGRPVPPIYRTIPDLLLYEGRQADAYWSALGIKRDYPHARDPVNACLNYAYGLLESRARLACHRAGLEPSVGFLHEAREQKESLIYDLQEPFRDTATKTALAVRKELNARDFGEVFGHGLRLRADGARRLLEAFARSFSDRALTDFTSRLTLRFGASGREAPTRQGRQTWGRTAPLLSASVRAL
jgi:CRISP-associated protein Cas1